MKESMASIVWRFSTSRMLQEYVERLYLPAAEAGQERAHEAAEGSAEPGQPVVAAEG
jgi:starch phosphorylase